MKKLIGGAALAGLVILAITAMVDEQRELQHRTAVGARN